MRRVVIGMGANLGAREAAFRAAIDLLEEGGEVSVEARSRLYDTAPVGPPQPRYLNAAVRVATDLPPATLLERTLEVERLLGRDRAREARWGPRTLDLDLLWASSGPERSERLTLPHPRLVERAFALAPLLDVAPPEVAAGYAPHLEACGGPPPSVSFDRPQLAREESDGGARLEVVARDRADALAALGELDRAEAPPGPRASVPIRTDAGIGGLAACLDALLARGHRLCWLTLQRLEGGAIRGRARVGPPEGPARRVRGLEVEAVEGGFRARLELG